MACTQQDKPWETKIPGLDTKTFVLTSSDGYPYHVIPYSGAKGLAGTPGKDLTSRVVIDFWTEFNGVKPNLAFDNWYTSTKLFSMLPALSIITVWTARVDWSL